MMNVMYTNGGIGFSVLWAVHILAVVASSVGVLLLLMWAFKHLTASQMKQWGWTLVIVGTLACLLTIGVMGHPWSGKMLMRHTNSAGMMRMGNDVTFTKGMMNDDDGMGMSMNAMTMMLEDKTGDEFDAAFLAMMIPHHQGAIDMANLASTNAKHAEIKTLAEAIIKAQETEIATMQKWQGSWGYDQ